MEIQTEQHQKAIIQALLELNENESWKLLKRELENQLNACETIIFDETRYLTQMDDRWVKKYSAVDLMVMKRNIIKKIIDLPEDILEQLDIIK